MSYLGGVTASRDYQPGDIDLLTLHRFLTLNVDKIERVMLENTPDDSDGDLDSLVKEEGRARTHLARKKLFAQLSTLLALLGSPRDVSKVVETSGKSQIKSTLALAPDVGYSEFRERMMKQGIEKRAQELQARQYFYIRKQPRDRRPVVYFIARRTVPDTLDMELFLYVLLNTLEAVENKKFDLVLDWYLFDLSNTLVVPNFLLPTSGALNGCCFCTTFFPQRSHRICFLLSFTIRPVL